MAEGTQRILQGTSDEPVGAVERDTFLALREKNRYERVWADPRYRLHSPGEKLVPQAFEMGMKEGETLIDYGCGCGRPLAAFDKLGLNVLGVDIAHNCLDQKLTMPVVRSCLWDLPEIASDWAFCTDVMEHIPEEKVDDVLSGIAQRTNKGAFFQIATRLDSSGMMIIGEQLHLTVKGSDWWKRKLNKAFQEVDLEEFSTWAVAQCK